MLTKKIKPSDKRIIFRRKKAHLTQCRVFSKSNSLHINMSAWSNVKYLSIIIIHFIIPSLLNPLLSLFPSFFTHFFIINSENLIQRQMLFFKTIFSINKNAKMGCTYLYTTFKYLGFRSYLACAPMLDFHSKHIIIKRVQYGALREKEKEWLRCKIVLSTLEYSDCWPYLAKG